MQAPRKIPPQTVAKAFPFWYNYCMKIFAISDLHLSINNPKPMNIFGPVWDNYLDTITADWQAKVGDEDLVLVAGDISWAMYLEKARPDLEFFAGLNGKKIIIRGNHDYWWKSISAVREILPKGMYALQNDALVFGNTVICGSRGWTTPEGKTQTEQDKKIYDRELIRMTLSLNEAKKKLADGNIIVMTHFPPFNSRGEPSPFTELFDGYGVKTVVYGHLHGNPARAKKTITINSTEYILSSCDLVGNRLVSI